MSVKRYSILVGIIVIILGFVGFFGFSNMFEAPKRKSELQKRKLVNVVEVENQSNTAQLQITGKLQAKERIELFAEVAGILKKANKDFKTGVAFNKGELMVFIDDEEASLNLIAEKNNFFNGIINLLPDIKLDYPDAFEKWQSYANSIEFIKPLPQLPDIDDLKEKNFVSANNIFQSYYRIQSQESRLSKYKISAPFDGVLANVSIQQGTLVRTNQKLADFIQTDVFELVGSVSYNEQLKVKVGAKVELLVPNKTSALHGTVVRKSPDINPQTQSIDLFVEVSDNSLFEGQFVKAFAQLGEVDSSYVLQRKLINELNEVFILKDSLIEIINVEIVHMQGNEVIVKGIPNNTLILLDRLNDLYPGMPVTPFIVNQ